jgi:hypothetical protein
MAGRRQTSNAQRPTSNLRKVEKLIRNPTKTGRELEKHEGKNKKWDEWIFAVFFVRAILKARLAL